MAPLVKGSVALHDRVIALRRLVMEADRFCDPQLIWREPRKRAAHSGEAERPRDFLVTARTRRRIDVHIRRARRRFGCWLRVRRGTAASRTDRNDRGCGKEGDHGPPRYWA